MKINTIVEQTNHTQNSLILFRDSDELVYDFPYNIVSLASIQISIDQATLEATISIWIESGIAVSGCFSPSSDINLDVILEHLQYKLKIEAKLIYEKQYQFYAQFIEYLMEQTTNLLNKYIRMAIRDNIRQHLSLINNLHRYISDEEYDIILSESRVRRVMAI